ncbi:MAG: glucose-6-phosphate isomerase [Thiotrichales bacterium]|jgi:glucose-6-phosphate isomerase|nr:glucose-6-phosphate isomerase [Thiotrichales bacterium]
MTLTQTPAWHDLAEHANVIKSWHLSRLFAQDEQRGQRDQLAACGITVNVSRQRMLPETWQLLYRLAEQQDLSTSISALFSGHAINHTEGRAALHTALRAEQSDAHDATIWQAVQQQLANMQLLVDKIRAGQWRGFSGRAITDVVNLGVGGSDLGPNLVVSALQQQKNTAIGIHYLSSMDGAKTAALLNKLNPHTTLFVFASKTFTTIDTLANAQTAIEWLVAHGAPKALAYQQHFVGVSANPRKMSEFGIHPEHQLHFWEWVGGRYSLWSTIGFTIAIAVGMPGFRALLQGAHAMDVHFRTATWSDNMPVRLALATVWNRNFLGIHGKAILPYDARLALLPAYLTQLIMESNGKSVDRNGRAVDYATCPIVWGEVGPNAQHAFYQLLHQGTEAVACDFIAPITRPDIEAEPDEATRSALHYQHQLALANLLAQSTVLMLGDAALETPPTDAHKHYAGNQPSNTILLNQLDAKTLGALIALYEHQTFVEAVIWNINPFDQWGVELGKQIALKTLQALQTGASSGFDQATVALIEALRNAG